MSTYSEAEVLLLGCLHTYLSSYYRDYPEYRKPCYLRQMLQVVFPKSYDDVSVSPIDVVFVEFFELGIECEEIGRYPSRIVAFNRLKKATPYEQVYSFYESFKSYPLEEQLNAIKTLALKLANAELEVSDN